jgi:uncharacterized protein YegL
MSIKRRVDNLNTLIISLILGTLGAILLLSILGRGAMVSAAQGEIMLNKSTHKAPGSRTAPATTTVPVTKTVEPSNPDTGGDVNICFTISGLEPHSLDVALALDVSESMTRTAGGGVTQSRLAASQAAASAFVSFLPITDRIAVVSYSTTAQLVQPLTTTRGAVTRTIYALTATGSTNIGEGINISHKELITSPRYTTDTIKTIILLSDGKANLPEDEETAEEYARERARAAASDAIKIYTIGFGTDAGEDLLREIADIGDGEYFFAPDADVLETIYLTIARELHNLTITDILPPGVETDCSQWPDDWCIVSPSGVTTITWPISDSLLTSDSKRFCFTATVNLDPGKVEQINLAGSGICYQDPSEQAICESFVNPTVTVGGRKITGYVFYDTNGNGLQEADEAGAPDVDVRPTGETASGTLLLPSRTTDMSGTFVIRTASASTTSVIIEIPSGYVATTPISRNVFPTAPPFCTVTFGIRAEIYLPIITRSYPKPIINGDFENGWIGWHHGGELTQTITSTNPHRGNFSALLGDPAYICQGGVPTGSAWITQTFYVQSTDNPRLVFWYNIVTQDINPYLNDEFDSFDVRIGVESESSLEFRDARKEGVYGCAPQEEEDFGWKPGEIDLSAYRGQKVTVRFENWNRADRWYNTWTFVDDVQFLP